MIRPEDYFTIQVKPTTDRTAFVWAVFDGDGSRPGSLHAASTAVKIEDAIDEALRAWDRAEEMRKCDHTFEPVAGSIRACSKCRYTDYTDVSERSET